MKSKSTLVVAVVALLVLAAGVYVWKFRDGGLQRGEVVPTEKTQQELDFEALKSSTASPYQTYGAMIRLSQQNETLARAEALKRATDPNPLLRGGAAQALGYFNDDETVAALKSLLNDKDKSVRMFAIQGLGHKSEALRETELLELLENPELELDAKVEIYASLLKAATTPERKTSAISNLIRIAKDGDSGANTEAALRLVSFAPDNAQVVELIRAKVSAGKNEKVTAVGIRFLSSSGDPWIRKYLKLLSGHPSPTVRSAVIQSLHRVCPPDRWEILEGLRAKEKDPAVMKLTLEEPMFLLGPTAITFLEAAVTDPSLDAEAKKVAEESLGKVKSSPGQELCAGKS